METLKSVLGRLTTNYLEKVDMSQRKEGARWPSPKQDAVKELRKAIQPLFDGNNTLLEGLTPALQKAIKVFTTVIAMNEGIRTPSICADLVEGKNSKDSIMRSFADWSTEEGLNNKETLIVHLCVQEVIPEAFMAAERAAEKAHQASVQAFLAEKKAQEEGK